MKKLKNTVCILAILLLNQRVQGQVVAKPGLSLQTAVLDFSTTFLNNPGNNNRKFSYLNQLEFHAPLSPYFSVFFNAGLGHLRNLGPDYLYESGSDIRRMGTGLIFNPNNGKFFLNENAKFIEPYAFVGYSFDYMTANRDTEFRNNVGIVRYGAGFWMQITDDLYGGYSYSLNQKLGQDYRSFNQHNLGILIRLKD